ncbi:MAG TPA: GNAT family N-acetyltransferase [Polyangiaceae bacterium]|nr:GNAT family N-acetyltransferase [Polyangiaceae bacterium]
MNDAKLRTERLELRPLSAEDFELVCDLSRDPRVMGALGGPHSAAKSSAWLERQLAHFRAHGYGRYVVSCDAQVVGLVGLSRTDFERGLVPGVEVAWRLAFEHWGQGYATEAARAVIQEGFERFGLAEVIAVTAHGNLRSRRVMERLGMRHSERESFDHPLLSPDDPLRHHVLYRLIR